MTRRLALVVLVLVLVVWGPAAVRRTAGPDAVPAAPAAAPARVELVVGLEAPAGELGPAAEALARALEGEVVRTSPALGCAVLAVPRGAGDPLARAAARPGVRYAEPNRRAAAAAGPGRCTCQGPPRHRPPAPDVHGLERAAEAIGLRVAWLAAPERGEGVLVGVVDTGVDAGSFALRGACEPGVDLVEEGGVAGDPHGHGTAMAGLIAGRGDGTSRGFLGVAPGARILPVRVADGRGAAPVERLARGIVAAADRGARIVYVGLGARGRSPTLAAAVRYAREAGALVVCPAGNEGLDAACTPAGEAGAFAVGGLGEGGALGLMTNLDPNVAVAAPSEHVPAPARDRVRFCAGTSVSAALAAGVAALAAGRDAGLDAAALERCLRAGSEPIPDVAGTALERRLGVRALDAVGAVTRADAAHAEVALARVEVSPDPPAAGVPAEVRLLVRNVGHRPLAGASVEVTIDGAARGETGLEGALAPGAERWLSVPWTPAANEVERPLEVAARVRAAPPSAARPGPPLPCAARGRRVVTPSAKPSPNFAIESIQVVAPLTPERATLAFDVSVINRGAAAGRGRFEAAVEGERRPAAALRLAPGQRATQRVAWSAPAGAAPRAPIQLEAYVEAEGDLDLSEDLDTLLVALGDPALPGEPLYRQHGDIDFAVDAPWRLAGGRDHLPLLVFVPSIGRPSRYATFHETLAIRRGVVARAVTRGSGRGAAARTNAGRVGRAAGNLGTYTAAMFLSELAAASRGDEADVRRFFNRIMTTDFALDYSLYAAGAAGGARAFDLVAARARRIRGLRWTGTNLGGAIARAQCSIALGYLLPNLVRGHLDRRVAIDLASLGLTTAAVEALAHGIGAGVSRTAVGARVSSWLARHGRVARAGGWAVQFGQLVLVLFVSDWISEAIDRPIARWEARRALRRSWEELRAAAREPDEAAFRERLEALSDAFDAYRNLAASDLEFQLRHLNKALRGVARTVYEIEAIRARTADSLPDGLRASRDRVLTRREAEAERQLHGILVEFEESYTNAYRGLYATDATATLDDPGGSKPALFDLELELVASLAATSEGSRRELLEARVGTLERLRDLDLEITRALVEDAGILGEAPDPDRLAGTDGLVIDRARIVARDRWHEATEDHERLREQPLRYAPPGAARERRVYEHDVDRDVYWAAPGLERLDELGEAQEEAVLLDMPRPLTVKGRYDILRVPRRLLEQVASGGRAWVEAELDWELTKVVRGVLVRPAAGRYSQTLQVDLADQGLPRLEGLEGGYLDAHYHTIAEWYNPEPGFVADIEFDAPRQKYGGPIPMLVESAWAVGAIDAPTYAAARHRLVTTDHNCFYVAGDQIWERPPFGPTAPGPSEGVSEQEMMRQLLGESVGEELSWQTPGVTSVGSHMLDYRARHVDGTWNAKQPVFRLPRALLGDRVAVPTLEGVLGAMARGGEGNERAFAYASHPVSGIPWEDARLREALTGYARGSDRSFVFKGMQVWNSRSRRHHSDEKLYKYLDDLNPFGDGAWRGGGDADPDLAGGLSKYRALLQELAAFRPSFEPRVRMVRKHYIIAGSDAHGDFNYTVGGAATVILALAGTNDVTDDTLEINDNAFMRVRSFVATAGFPAPAHMNALAHGAVVVTDGPLVWFEVDGDGRFDASTGAFDAGAARFREAEGRIGGQGAFDGARTVVLANDARPVVRYRYTNLDEFGRPAERDAAGRVARRDGTIAAVYVHRTSWEDGAARGQATWAPDGQLDTRGGRAFGEVLEAPLDAALAGGLGDVTALQLEAVTARGEQVAQADQYRAITNPVWAVRVGVQAHLDPARFDAARGEVLPGGLTLELTSPLSLAPDALTLELRALDAEGRSGGVLLTLEPLGWAEGADADGRPFLGGRFLARNTQPLRLADLPRFGGAARGGAAPVTLVVATAEPLRDAFGNVLNRVAATFEVDPTTGAPGAHADARTDLPEVSPPTGLGIVPVLEGAAGGGR